jgi:alcohol dehydrogenase YqhD (iron-dependent ADH family)
VGLELVVPVVDLVILPVQGGDDDDPVGTERSPEIHVVPNRNLPARRPDQLLDPELLAFIPPKVAAETGGDALTHAIESYVSLNSNVITEGLALTSIRMIGTWS